MKAEKQTKTNAMRLLEEAGIAYSVMRYEVDEDDLSGVHAAEKMGVDDAGRVIKTLVTRGSRGGFFVFCIPVAEELDLKRCAAAAGEKSVEMIHVKEMPAVTGYIRGGCSPVGMKKLYPTFLDETAALYDEILVSAGQRGVQLRLAPQALARAVGARFAALTR